MKQTTTEWTCELCGVVEETEGTLWPRGWSVMVVKVHEAAAMCEETPNLFKGDLCESCQRMVKEAFSRPFPRSAALRKLFEGHGKAPTGA